MARPAHRSRGFSLLELMLVLTIMAALAAIAGFNLVAANKRAMKKTTIASMHTIKRALDNYFLENQSTYPPNLDALVPEYIESPGGLKDSWGERLYYNTPGGAVHPYSLVSFGPDKQDGTDDDLDIWVIMGEQ